MRVGKRLVGVEFDEALDLMDLAAGEMLGSGDIGVAEGFFTGVVERDGMHHPVAQPGRMSASGREKEKEKGRKGEGEKGMIISRTDKRSGMNWIGCGSGSRPRPAWT